VKVEENIGQFRHADPTFCRMMRRVLVAILIAATLLAATTAGLIYWLVAGDGTRLALERQATAWLGQPVRIGAADARILPRIGVRLREVAVGEPATLSLGSVEISTGLRALLSRRIENADVILSDSRIELPLPFALPEGASAAAGGTGIEVVSIRSIRLDDVVIASRGREVSVSADSSLADDTLTVNSLSAASSGTSVEGRGVIRLLPVLDAQLDLTANELNLDDLMALAEGFAPGGGGRRAAPSDSGRLVARVSAESVTAGGLTVPQFFTTVRVQGTRVGLSPTRFLLFGGRYEGDLDLSLADGSITLASKIRDVDVAQLAAFGGVPDTISGRMSGGGTLSGRGTDIASILATARGTGTVSIVDGAIRRLNLVRTVVLFFGRPAPGTDAATDAFERLDATFALANRVVTAEALSLRSRDADIVATGTLSLETKALAGRADLSLSDELSKQAGTDLLRYTREGNRIVLPATIGGTLGAPRLSIDAAAAVRRGLRNEVERRLKGLLDRFSPPAAN
jgi:hypothetical protein